MGKYKSTGSTFVLVVRVFVELSASSWCNVIIIVVIIIIIIIVIVIIIIVVVVIAEKLIKF